MVTNRDTNRQVDRQEMDKSIITCDVGDNKVPAN